VVGVLIRPAKAGSNAAESVKLVGQQFPETAATRIQLKSERRLVRHAKVGPVAQMAAGPPRAGSNIDQQFPKLIWGSFARRCIEKRSAEISFRVNDIKGNLASAPPRTKAHPRRINWSPNRSPEFSATPVGYQSGTCEHTRILENGH
jgi:hypothetical protein